VSLISIRDYIICEEFVKNMLHNFDIYIVNTMHAII